MANTRQIKRRITSAKNISKITGAMEMVAASKMKRAQNQAVESRTYSQALESSLRTVASFADPSLHPLLSRPTTGQPVLIIVTTDKGLCGSLNTNIFKLVIQWKHAHPNGTSIVIGKKGVMFTRLIDLPLLAQFTELPEKISVADILPITEFIKEKFLDHSFSSVEVIYTDFINTLSQRPVISQLLPIHRESVEEDKPRISPQVAPTYMFEPSPQTILSELLPYFIENKMYHVMLEARASEHSARMVAMKNASENAQELVAELQLLFNKSRQASITSELLDITTSIMSLSH